MTVVCKSTRYGAGCGHPVNEHDGPPQKCCCCSWRQNDPAHVETCARCKPILDAYVARQSADARCPACGFDEHPHQTSCCFACARAGGDHHSMTAAARSQS